jgi:dihydrofolate reductase
MRNVIYLMNVSLDGFVEGRNGKFDWSWPDEEVFRFHIDMARDMSAFLYGRRMYETMAVWQTMEEDTSLSESMREYARIWKSKPKIVFSTALKTVGPGCRLAQGDIASEVRMLKQQPGGPLGVSGPGLAFSLARLDLIDEYRLVVYPVLVGGGKSYFPGLDGEKHLRLLETRTFGRGEVYLRYARA